MYAPDIVIGSCHIRSQDFTGWETPKDSESTELESDLSWRRSRTGSFEYDTEPFHDNALTDTTLHQGIYQDKKVVVKKMPVPFSKAPDIIYKLNAGEPSTDPLCLTSYSNRTETLFVMAHRGETLHQHYMQPHSAFRRLEPQAQLQQILTVIEAIITQLSAIHSLSYVHGDLHLKNIMILITKQINIFIIDKDDMGYCGHPLPSYPLPAYCNADYFALAKIFILLLDLIVHPIAEGYSQLQTELLGLKAINLPNDPTNTAIQRLLTELPHHPLMDKYGAWLTYFIPLIKQWLENGPYANTSFNLHEVARTLHRLRTTPPIVEGSSDGCCSIM